MYPEIFHPLLQEYANLENAITQSTDKMTKAALRLFGEMELMQQFEQKYSRADLVDGLLQIKQLTGFDLDEEIEDSFVRIAQHYQTTEETLRGLLMMLSDALDSSEQ